MTAFTFWDILLICVATFQALPLAYVHSHELKSLIWSLPVPFTVAVLAVGAPVGAHHALGLIVLLGYFHLVRVLYQNAGVNIVVSIIAGFAFYCAVGSVLAHVVPLTDTTFWWSVALTALVAGAFWKFMPSREERGHKSDLHVVYKGLLILSVMIFLVLIKKNLQGFMTVAPMLGIIAAYESRHSLWSFSRRIPIFMATTLGLMAVIRLGQPHAGLAASLTVGWVVYLILLFSLRSDLRRFTKRLVKRSHVRQ